MDLKYLWLRGFRGTPALLVGMALGSPGVVSSAEPPTYHRDVAAILQKNCQECHRPGQVAPFSLLDYAQARKRARDIVAVTDQRSMPPWHASTTVGGPFQGARVLTARELKTLADWADAGRPEGNPKDGPPAREWSSDWALGPPDLVLKMPEPYNLASGGADEYRVVVLPSGLTKGRWIAAADFKPGNRKVVHHILSAYDVSGNARKLDEADPGPGYATSGGGYGRLPNGLPFFPAGQLWGWAPGRTPRLSPEGTARALPAGADVLLQIHYHKAGKPETDATTIGLYFAKGPVDKQIHSGVVLPARAGVFAKPDLRIPPGAPNHEVKGSLTIRQDSHVLAVFPHMHWLGKDFESAGGPARWLAAGPDPDRRLGFRLAEPLRVRETRGASQGDQGRDGGPFRQLGGESPQSQQAPDRGPVGRADDRRDVHRLPPAHARRRAPGEPAAG